MEGSRSGRAYVQQIHRLRCPEVAATRQVPVETPREEAPAEAGPVDNNKKQKEEELCHLVTEQVLPEWDR